MERGPPYQRESQNNTKSPDFFAFLKANREQPRSSSFFSENGLSQDIIQVTDAEPDICLEVFYALYHVLLPQIERIYDVSFKNAWKMFIGDSGVKGILCPPEKLIRVSALQIKRSLSQPGGENQIFQELDQAVNSIICLKQKVIDYPGEILQREEISAALLFVGAFYQGYQNKMKILVQTISEKEQMDEVFEAEFKALEDLLEPKAIMMSDSFPHHWAYRILRNKARKILSFDDDGRPIQNDSNNHRVAAFPDKSQASEPLVFFKANGIIPIQPEKEFMLSSLYKHLQIPVPESALLVITNVIETNPAYFYAVQASEAVNGESAFESYKNTETIFEEEAYALQVIGALLTNPSDSSFSNFKYSSKYKTLISISNSSTFKPELIGEDDGKVVNMKSILYLSHQIDLLIPESIKTLFTTLNPSLTIYSWLHDLSEKNKAYQLLFTKLAFQETRRTYQNLLPESKVLPLTICLEKKVLVDPDLHNDHFNPQILVSESLLSKIAEKLQLIEQILLNHRSISAQTLFDEVSPILGKYYRKLRSEFIDPEEAFDAMWGSEKNVLKYSKISTLLDDEEFESLLNNKIVEDGNLLPEMFLNEYKDKLISEKTPPLDKFIQYQSQLKMMDLLNPAQTLKDFQFLIHEGLINSQSPRDTVDFWYSVIEMTENERHPRAEIQSLLSNLPSSELKWFFTVEKYFGRADRQIAMDLGISSIFVTGAFMKARRFILTESERDYLSDWQRNLKSNASLTGRSAVTIFPEQNPEFSLKQYPYWPGYSFASILFMRLLGITHLPNQDLLVIRSELPVLLTQAVEGSLVSRVWHDPEAFNSLDPFHTGLLIICAMLINPEDSKEDNFILSQDGKYLIPIENDCYFLPSFSEDEGSFYFPFTVNTAPQTKTILFCLGEMKQPIDPQVKHHICSINFDRLLTSWLTELEKTENKLKNLIDQTQSEEFLKKGTVMSIPFFKPFIQNLHWKAHKIQDILKTANEPTPFDLLKAVEPFAAKCYQDSFTQGNSLQTRFSTATKDRGRVNLDIQKMMRTIHSPRSNFEKGSIFRAMQPFDSLEFLKELLEEQSQTVKNELDLIYELDNKNKEEILTTLFGSPLSEIDDLKDFFEKKKEGLILKGSKLATSKTLKDLFEFKPAKGMKIRFLSLPDSPLLSEKEIRILAERCPNLEYLDVSGCGRLQEIITENREWHLLARLEAKECLNLDKFVSFSPIKVLRIDTDCQIYVFIENSSLDVFTISKKTEQFELNFTKGDTFEIKFLDQTISSDILFLNLLRDETETRNYFRDIKIIMGKNSISSGKDLMVFIKDINLQISNIKVDDLKRMKILKLINLKRLDLSRNRLKGKGYLEHLIWENWPKLIHLNLSGNEIHDVGLEILAQGNWPLLEVLNLQETKITAVGVETFIVKARWEKLKDLNISENKISDKALVALYRCQGNWPLLETLNLKNTDITKRALLIFLLNSNFLNLQTVNVSSSGKNLVNSLLQKKWSELEELNLSDYGITQNEVEVLVNKCAWPKLKFLNLSNNDINDKGIEILCQGDCPKLEILNCKKTKITSMGVEEIVNKAKWTQIKHLNLSDNEINDEGLRIISRGDWPLLETLNLEKTAGAKKGLLSFILDAKWTNLQEINFGWSGKNFAKNLVQKNWHLLEELDLSESRIAQKELKLIVEKCNWLQLKHLNLSSNPEVDDEGLAVLCQRNWPMLETLNLENTGVTKKALLNLLLDANWPNFKTLLLPKWWNNSDTTLASSFIQKDLSQVERLEFNNLKKIEVIKVEAILSINKCIKLKYLNLSDNEISQEGKISLSGITECPLLEVLYLRNIRLSSNEIATILNESNWHQLKHLDLSNNPLFDEEFPVALFLADWPLLEILNLSKTNLSLQGVEAILDLSKWQQLRHFDVSQNELFDEGLSMLALMDWPLLEVLNLSQIKCSSKGLEALVNERKWPQLKHLDLSNNDLFDESLSAFTLAEWPLLEELNFKNTKITQNGLEVLVNQMKFQKLKKLDISENAIFDEGLKILASGEWPLFEHLVYYDTQITIKGQMTLLEKMKWPNLQHLEHSLYESFDNYDENVLAAVPVCYKKQYVMVIILDTIWRNSKEISLTIKHQDLNEKVIILPCDKLNQLESINLSFDALPKIKAFQPIILPSSLKRLDLSKNSLTDHSNLENLIFKNCLLLEELQLKKTNITTKGIEILFSQTGLHNLKNLDISQNIIENEGLEILASVGWHLLENLDLEKTEITDEGIEIMVRISNWPSLKKLNISRKKIQDKGLEMLCSGKWPLLEYLNLQTLDFTEKGIESIINKSEWPNLKTLDLSFNKNILDEGSESLASGNWPLLENLYLDSTNVELKVVEILAKRSSWSKLKEISLLDNIEISDHRDTVNKFIFRKWPNVKLGI